MVVAAAPVLLYGTTYLTDLGGPDAWSPRQAWLILGGLAAVWVPSGLCWPSCLAGPLASRTQFAWRAQAPGRGSRSCSPVMPQAGRMGCRWQPLFWALLYPRCSCSHDQHEVTGQLGVAILGLFSLLVIGRFFGELTAAHAILLFVAPLLGWLPELPVLRRIKPWVRGLARVILAAVLVSAVVGDAARRFVEKSQVAADAQGSSLGSRTTPILGDEAGVDAAKGGL